MKDIDIARAADIKPVTDIAVQLGVELEDLELYGQYKEKLPLKLIDEKISYCTIKRYSCK